MRQRTGNDKSVPGQHDEQKQEHLPRSFSLEITPGLQLVSELAGLLAWEFDTQSGTFSWSPNAETILGTVPPTSLRAVLDIVYPEDREVVQSAFDRWIQQGLGFDIEHRIVKAADESIIWLRCRGAAFADEHQSGSRLLGVAQDITEYKLHKSNALFLADIQNRLASTSITDESVEATGEEILRYLGLTRIAIYDVSLADDRLTPLIEQRSGQAPFESSPSSLSRHFSPEAREQLARGEHVIVAGMVPNTFNAADSDEPRPLTTIYVPHIEEGEWSMLLGAQQERPRIWPSEEIDLLRVMTERLCLRIANARIEHDLKQSEHYYRTLFESIDEGFCIIEMLFDEHGIPDDYRFLEVNPAFRKHTGELNVVGKRMKELAPDLEDRWFEIYGQVALTGEPRRFTEQTRAIGNRWFDVHAFRVGNSTLHQVALLFTDVTDRKHTEDMLRESEARVHRVMEIDSVGIIFFQPGGLVTYANQAFLRMSGYTRGDVVNGLVRWDTMTPPEWMPSARRAINEFLSMGRIAPYEKEYVRKDGTRWWGLFAASRISEGEGVKFIIDITDSKQAEVERARLADIVEDSNDAIVRCDPDGTIVDVNHAATELYRTPVDRMIGSNIMDTSPPERQHEFSENYARLLCGEPVPPWETVRRRSDGTEMQVEIRMSPIRDVRGHMIGCSGVVRDVSERKRLEQAQEDFLAMASHDLRSPVTVLLGRAQLMRRRKAYDEVSIRTIIDQARRIERLTTDLQHVVHLESGKLELSSSLFDLNELAFEATERLRSSAPTFEFETELAADPVVGDWDRNRLNQVLDNLLLNAVKYSPDGGRITVRVSADDESAQLRITDHGVGIAKKLQERLFTRFYRADDAGIASGLGLGLYISRMLIEAHGGTITVDSRPGAGSVFTVTLPRRSVRD